MSYVDLERGRYYRLQQGAAKTNKRQPTVPIPSRLLAQSAAMAPNRPRGEALRRVQRQAGDLGQNGVQERCKARWARSRNLASTLRHTAATWLMQRGADPWQAAGYLGMSLEVLLNTYGHHHPDYLSDAVEKIAKREPVSGHKAQSSGSVIPLLRNKPE